MYRKSLLAYFGHHKCATQTMSSIAFSASQSLNLKFGSVHTPPMFENNLPSFVEENKISFLAYTNANIDYVEHLDDFLGFHVIRDPRDIVVSAYFSHLNSHPTNIWPELIEHRKKLKEVSIKEGLLLEMEFSRTNLDNLDSWNYDQENILEIKLEDFMKSPYDTTVGIFSHLNIADENNISLFRKAIYPLGVIVNKADRKMHGMLPFKEWRNTIPVESILGYVYENQFSMKSKGRNRGKENKHSHYRKGVAGDWRNYFMPCHCAYFKERYNHLLIKLGYEASSDW